MTAGDERWSLEAALERAPFVVYVRDAAGRFAFLGPGAEALFGRPREACLASPSFWRDGVAQDDREALEAHLARMADDERAVELYRFRRADDVYVWLRDATKAFRGPDGERWFAGGLLEIEERRPCSPMDLLESVRAVSWELDIASGRFVHVGSAFETVFGRPRTAIEGGLSAFLAWVGPEDRRGLEVALRAALTSGGGEIEYRLQRSDGEIRWLRTRAALRRAGLDGLPVLDGMTEDVTERRGREEREKERGAELERELARRTEEIRTLERQRAEAERAAAAARMAARIAHEINNPLASVRSAFALVKQAVPPDHPHAPFAARMDREIERMTTIVRRMCELYVREPGPPACGDAGRALAEVARQLRDEAASRGVELRVAAADDVPWIVLDHRSLEQVLYALLRNAVEASRSGTVVDLGAERRGALVRISIADRGAGIPEEARQIVFEPFYTTKPELSSARLGLGLSFCRAIVTSCGGAIDFAPRDGGGTVFWVEIPAASAEDR